MIIFAEKMDKLLKFILIVIGILVILYLAFPLLVAFLMLVLGFSGYFD